MKKPKIKFICEVAGTTVLFQILEMDERARRSDLYFEAKNGLTVLSKYYPEISTQYIHLHGSEAEKDFNYSVRKYSINTHALEHKEKIVAALKDWAENWYGWKEETEEEEEENTGGFNVYGF